MKWETMFRILKRIGVTYMCRRINKSLYELELGVIRRGNGQGEVEIRNGVVQRKKTPCVWGMVLRENS